MEMISKSATQDKNTKRILNLSNVLVTLLTSFRIMGVVFHIYYNNQSVSDQSIYIDLVLAISGTLMMLVLTVVIWKCKTA